MIAGVAPLRMRRLSRHMHEWFIGVVPFVESTNVVRRQCALLCKQVGVTRRQNATRHRHKMRHKRQAQFLTMQGLSLQLLRDLWKMLVPCDLVGADILVNLGVVRREREAASSATYARLRIDDRARLDDACREGRCQGQNRGRRVTARIGDEGRAPNALSMQFTQAIDSRLKQSRNRMCMFVPLLVCINIAQAEIRREVHHLRPALEQACHSLGGGGMWQADKRQVGPLRLLAQQQGWIERGLCLLRSLEDGAHLWENVAEPRLWHA